ncbi:hypothetical protein Trydic_g13168 [Trypoxylus dichotomus]
MELVSQSLLNVIAVIKASRVPGGQALPLPNLQPPKQRVFTFHSMSLNREHCGGRECHPPWKPELKDIIKVLRHLCP